MGAAILGAIGVVYGDIGTSVLYAVQTVFDVGQISPTPANVYGILSLFFWTLTLIVSLKYVTLVLRADNHGEGGLVALLALATQAVHDRPRTRNLLLLLGIFGACLFYGDGVITPAISVLSAVEGLEVVSPTFQEYVIPITLVVLLVLFVGLALGGITKTMCDMMDEGLIDRIVDAQVFDTGAIESIKNHPGRHIEISTSEYADPFNKASYVNHLDFVILASLEVDTHFNCNVVVGSDGIITGAQGGHPDTAQGAKCTIVIAPLLQGRIPAICTDVTTVTTPGESVDIVVTDYGVAVNPRRPDLLEALKAADCVPLKTIEELRDIAYSIVGEPEKVQFGDRIVGIIEARDGTVMDVVREVKPFSFRED